MKGSQKQIKWAEDIKNKKLDGFNEIVNAAKDETAAVVLKKIVDYILNIEKAKFWIDYRDYSEYRIIDALFRGSLLIDGFNNDKKAKFDPATTTVTESWKVIVQDGRGGHYEERKNIVKL